MWIMPQAWGPEKPHPVHQSAKDGILKERGTCAILQCHPVHEGDGSEVADRPDECSEVAAE